MATQAVEVPVKRPSLRERFDLGNGFSPYLLVLPTVLVILAVTAYPILSSVWQSFYNNPLSAVPSFVGLQNYALLFRSSEFLGAVKTTFIFTGISVALETVFGLAIALLINGTFPGRGL